MEMGEGVTMRMIVTAVVLWVCNLAAAGCMRGVDVRGDSLLRWPEDYKGVAVVPSEVRHINSSAFSGCSELTAVELPESLETIGQLAFSGCARLGEIRIPAKVTDIGRSAFFNCQALTNASVFAKIGKLPENIFSYCRRLRNVDLPEGLADIGDMAFRGCRSLPKIDIPGSVRRVGRGAFVGCSRLSDVELPEGIDLVDECAFTGCYDLKRLILHSVPEEIGEGAFKDCCNLRWCVLSSADRKHALYSVPSCAGITSESICREECLVGSYETVEEVLSFVDTTGEEESDGGVLEGLGRALRIAADGMADERPEAYPIGETDFLAANLFKLSARDSAREIKEFFKAHSETSLDGGNRFVANLSVSSDMAITLELCDSRLTRITLSDGLKRIIRGRLEKEKGVADDCVMKWLE